MLAPAARLALVAVMGGALVGCAGAGADAPSFAIPASATEAGRVAVSFPGTAVPEPIVGDPLGGPVPVEPEAAIAAIANRAAGATAAFAQAAPAARRLAEAARGADFPATRRVEAELGLADLISHHGRGQLALAQFDQLAEALARSEASPALIVEVAAAQTRLAGTLDEQDAQLTAIAALLDR